MIRGSVLFVLITEKKSTCFYLHYYAFRWHPTTSQQHTRKHPHPQKSTPLNLNWLTITLPTSVLPPPLKFPGHHRRSRGQHLPRFSRCCDVTSGCCCHWRQEKPVVMLLMEEKWGEGDRRGGFWLIFNKKFSVWAMWSSAEGEVENCGRVDLRPKESHQRT